MNALKLGLWVMGSQFPNNLTGRLVCFKFCSSLTRKNHCLGASALVSASKGKLFSQPRQARGIRVTAAPSYIGASTSEGKGASSKSHKDSSACALPVEPQVPFVGRYAFCSSSAWERLAVLRFLSQQCQYFPRTCRSVENMAGKVDPMIRRQCLKHLRFERV